MDVFILKRRRASSINIRLLLYASIYIPDKIPLIFIDLTCGITV